MRERAKDLGRPIYQLQKMLRLLSQADSRLLPLIPDGIYGANTYAAVRTYQERNGLPSTGTVDLQTWALIVSQYNTALLSANPADGLYLIQAMLAAVSEQYPEFSAPPVTGKNNPQTNIGLQRIQLAANLPASGNPSPETQQALRALYQSVL